MEGVNDYGSFDTGRVRCELRKAYSATAPTEATQAGDRSFRLHRSRFAYTTEVVSPKRSESIRLHWSRFAYIEVDSLTLNSSVYNYYSNVSQKSIRQRRRGSVSTKYSIIGMIFSMRETLLTLRKFTNGI